MIAATAELAPWIRLEKTSRTHFEHEETAGSETKNQLARMQIDSPSALEFGPLAPGSVLPGAQWFQAIQQKIAASTIPPGYEPEDPGSWLSQQVAAAALTFLSKSSYEFALAPYLYGSPSGELIAEFGEGEAKSTFIISPDSVTAFSVVKGKPIFKKRLLREWSSSRLRFWREKTLAPPSGKTHGQMGSY
jgi:hypothetical protein